MILLQNTYTKATFLINFIWFFLMTLDSFYFYQISMPLFSVTSSLLALILLIFNKINFSSNYKTPLLILVYILFISLITSIFNSHLFYIQRLPFVILLIPVIIYSVYMFNEKKILMLSILKYTLIIHILFFSIQLLYFYGTGLFIDYIYPITGESQRALGGSYTLGGVKLIRATGLFNEPGTYSTFMFCIFLVYKNLKKRIYNIDKIQLLDVIFIITIMMTFSVFGLIFTFIYAIVYLTKVNFSNKIIIMLAIIPFAYISYVNYLTPRFTENDTKSFSFREEGIMLYMQYSSEDLFHLLLGHSGFININELFGVVIAWDDIGLWFAILVNYGLISFILFIIITIKRFKYFYLLIIITLLSKMSFTTIFLWFIISYIYSYNVNFNKPKNLVV